jgi:hypothetical protein
VCVRAHCDNDHIHSEHDSQLTDIWSLSVHGAQPAPAPVRAALQPSLHNSSTSLVLDAVSRVAPSTARATGQAEEDQPRSSVTVASL